MRITAEMSLYPLADDYKPVILAFINDLQDVDGLEIVTNQLSTQLRGEFDVVTGAINACLKQSMERFGKQILVVKYLAADIDISRAPDLS